LAQLEKQAHEIFIELRTAIHNRVEEEKHHVTFPPSDLSFAAVSASQNFEDAVDRVTVAISARMIPSLQFEDFGDPVISDEMYAAFMVFRSDGEQVVKIYEAFVIAFLKKFLKSTKKREGLKQFAIWVKKKTEEYTSHLSTAASEAETESSFRGRTFMLTQSEVDTLFTRIIDNVKKLLIQNQHTNEVLPSNIVFANIRGASDPKDALDRFSRLLMARCFHLTENSEIKESVLNLKEYKELVAPVSEEGMKDTIQYETLVMQLLNSMSDLERKTLLTEVQENIASYLRESTDPEANAALLVEMKRSRHGEHVEEGLKELTGANAEDETKKRSNTTELQDKPQNKKTAKQSGQKPKNKERLAEEDRASKKPRSGSRDVGEASSEKNSESD
jgi:hypothetical protein